MSKSKKVVVGLTQEQEYHKQNTDRMAVLKHGISMQEKFAKLRADPLFVELIGELYIKEEGANLVQLLADPSTNNADSQRSIQMRLGGISAFQSFMSQYVRAGLTAKAELAQLESINAQLDLGHSVEDVLAALSEAQG